MITTPDLDHGKSPEMPTAQVLTLVDLPNTLVDQIYNLEPGQFGNFWEDGRKILSQGIRIVNTDQKDPQRPGVDAKATQYQDVLKTQILTILRHQVHRGDRKESQLPDWRSVIVGGSDFTYILYSYKDQTGGRADLKQTLSLAIQNANEEINSK